MSFTGVILNDNLKEKALLENNKKLISEAEIQGKIVKTSHRNTLSNRL